MNELVNQLAVKIHHIKIRNSINLVSTVTNKSN